MQTRFRRCLFLVLGLTSLVQAPTTLRAQDASTEPRAPRFGETGAPVRVELTKKDGSTEVVAASRIAFYNYSPGMSKPRRQYSEGWHSKLGSSGGKGGMGGMMGGGMMGSGMMGSGMMGGGMMGGGLSGGMGGPGAMMGSGGAMMSGSGGMGGGGMAGSAAPMVILNAGQASVELVAIAPVNPNASETDVEPLRADLVVGLLTMQVANFEEILRGGGGGYSDAGMGGMEGGGMSLVPLGIIELDAPAPLLAQIAPRFTSEELELLGDLVAYDLWIDDVRLGMRGNKDNEEMFRKLEQELKKLLSLECQALLAKQKIDVGRLRDKLKQLEDDLARRAAAIDRVVDVQHGKFVLEAQGLIGQ